MWDNGLNDNWKVTGAVTFNREDMFSISLWVKLSPLSRPTITKKMNDAGLKQIKNIHRYTGYTFLKVTDETLELFQVTREQVDALRFNRERSSV